jgi:AcrR family transcriptional regulator
MTEDSMLAATVGVRERIIAAAVELLHERGINALTQQRVSELAGVRQSHLTYYFPTRSDLLKQAVLAGMAALVDLIEGPQAKTTTIEEFREALMAQFADRRRARMMAGLVVASEEDAALRPWLERFQTDMIDKALRGFQARGLNPKRAAVEQLQATVVGAQTLDLAASSAASRRRLSSVLCAAFEQLVASTELKAARPRRALAARRSSRRPR